MARTFLSHGLPRITSKAPLQSKTSNALSASVPPTVTLPVHCPIDLILSSLATLIHVGEGSIGLRQWPYRSQQIFEMQFLIAPSSTWPVALTIIPFGPWSCMHC